jgi:hypothetical protein
VGEYNCPNLPVFLNTVDCLTLKMKSLRTFETSGNDTVSYPRRLESPSAPLREPHMSHKVIFVALNDAVRFKFQNYPFGTHTIGVLRPYSLPCAWHNIFINTLFAVTPGWCPTMRELNHSNSEWKLWPEVCSTAVIV